MPARFKCHESFMKLNCNLKTFRKLLTKLTSETKTLKNIWETFLQPLKFHSTAFLTFF